MTNGNDSAYPEIFTECDGATNSTGGLTKREYFAAMAMQGMLASPQTPAAPDTYASLATHAADALIEALNKEQP